MRVVTFILLLVICYSCSSTKNTTAKPGILNGAWVPIRQELGGKPMPAGFFENQKLIINDSTYTLIAESVDKGIIKYKGYKLDIYGIDGVNSGKHFMAIYKLENEELTVCYNLSGDSYPQSFETNDKPMFFLSVFRKSIY